MQNLPVKALNIAGRMQSHITDKFQRPKAKRGQENFNELVRECMFPVNVLSRVSIEKFAARAHAYICTYHHLDQKFEEANSAAVGSHTTMSTDTKQELLYNEIERLMKVFKGHRYPLILTVASSILS